MDQLLSLIGYHMIRKKLYFLLKKVCDFALAPGAKNKTAEKDTFLDN